MKNKVKKKIRTIEVKELLAKARSMLKTTRKKGTTMKMKLRRKRNPLNRRSQQKRKWAQRLRDTLQGEGLFRIGKRSTSTTSIMIPCTMVEEVGNLCGWPGNRRRVPRDVGASALPSGSARRDVGVSALPRRCSNPEPVPRGSTREND